MCPVLLNFRRAVELREKLLSTQLHYCNSVYHNLQNYQLNRLQQIQNSLARAVVKVSKSSHITPILISPLA